MSKNNIPNRNALARVAFPVALAGLLFNTAPALAQDAQTDPAPDVQLSQEMDGAYIVL